MSLPVWIPGSLDPCGTKRTSGPRPWACDTSLEPSWQKKLIHEKKFQFGRPARGNVVRLLHKILQNDRFVTKANKIS